MFNPFQVVLKDPGHGKPADWWSLGIFFFDLVTGRSPFSSNRGKKVVKENIMRGKFNIPPYITQDAQDLLRYVSHAIASRLNSTFIGISSLNLISLSNYHQTVKEALKAST